jgi:anti-anti-sigma factor
MLSFETSEHQGVQLVTFEETAETGDSRQTSQRQGLYQMIESLSDPRFAFDLGAVRYLTSSDIGFLITLRRRIGARHGRVVIFAIDDYLVDVFKTMRLHTLFEFAHDMREALTRLSVPSAT